MQSSTAQITFNKRHAIGFGSWYASIYLQENSYLVSGYVADTSGGVYTKLLTSVLNLEGEPIMQKSFGSPDQEFSSSKNSDSELPNLFLHQGYDIRNDEVVAWLAFFNEVGDTLYTRNYLSPYYQLYGTFANTPLYSLISTIDTSQFVVTAIYNTITGNDLCIWKFLPSGEVDWTYIHNSAARYEHCYILVEDQTGIIVALVEEYPNDQFFTNGINNQPYFIHLTTDGAIDWTWNLEEMWDIPDIVRIEDMLTSSDDHLVFTGKSTIYPDSVPIGFAGKCNLEGELLWFKDIGTYHSAYTFGGGNVFKSIVETSDGNYVAVGEELDFVDEPNELDGTLNHDAWLVKFEANTGEVLWERYYRYVVSPFDKHRVYDCKATPDGGLIFCGEATDSYTGNDWPYENPIQRAWVCKLDECGCLVPGCDPSCTYTTIDELEEKGNKTFIVGPNPLRTGESLNIYLFENPKNASFKLFDLNGREIDQFIPENGNTTYIWNPKIASPGMYVLVYEDEGRREELKILVE